MKRGIFSILAILAVFAMVTLGCPEAPVPVIPEVKTGFLSLVADGSASSTTTELYLTFSKEIDDLAAKDITISGVAGTEKGNLVTKDAPFYTLKLKTVTAGGTLRVIVKDPATDEEIEGSPRSVKIYFKAPEAGDTAVKFDDISQDGKADDTTTTKLTLKFDKPIQNLSAGDIKLSGMTNVTKGDPLSLSATSGEYTLPVDVKGSGTLSVTVSKDKYQISGNPKSVPVYFVTQVTLSSVTTDGEAGKDTTTKLLLAFDHDPGITAEHITLTGKEGFTVTKGALTHEGAFYTLPISGFTSAGVLTVAVAKPGYKIIGSPKENVPVHYKMTAVTLDSVEQDGKNNTATEDGVTTTKLTLKFIGNIPLTAEDIVITPATVTKGTLASETTATGIIYTLPIRDFGITAPATSADLTVTIADKLGYKIDGSPKPVKVYYFEQGVAFSELTQNGSANATTTTLTLTLDKAVSGFAKEDITFTGVTGVNIVSINDTAAPVYVLTIDGFIVPATVGADLTVTLGKYGVKFEPTFKVVKIFYVEKAVTLSAVTANGKAGETLTDELTLTFSEAIPTLRAEHITLVPALTKGTLTPVAATPGAYTLGITGITETVTTVTVSVSVPGYNVAGSPKTTDVHYAAPANQLAITYKLNGGTAAGAVDDKVVVNAPYADADSTVTLLNPTPPAGLSLLYWFFTETGAKLTASPVKISDLDPSSTGAAGLSAQWGKVADGVYEFTPALRNVTAIPDRYQEVHRIDLGDTFDIHLYDKVEIDIKFFKSDATEIAVGGWSMSTLKFKNAASGAVGSDVYNFGQASTTATIPTAVLTAATPSNLVKYLTVDSGDASGAETLANYADLRFMEISKITFLKRANAAAPVISGQPANKTFEVGGAVPELSVTAVSPDGGVLSYQWRSATAETGGTTEVISGATSATFTPSISTAASATFWFDVVITNTNNNATDTKTATTTSNRAKISSEAERPVSPDVNLEIYSLPDNADSTGSHGKTPGFDYADGKLFVTFGDGDGAFSNNNRQSLFLPLSADQKTKIKGIFASGASIKVKVVATWSITVGDNRMGLALNSGQNWDQSSLDRPGHYDGTEVTLTKGTGRDGEPTHFLIQLMAATPCTLTISSITFEWP